MDSLEKVRFWIQNLSGHTTNAPQIGFTGGVAKSGAPYAPFHPILAGIGAVAAIAYAFSVRPAEGFMAPQLARIVFFHLPCALASTVWTLTGVLYAFRYFSYPNPEISRKMLQANGLATLLAILTLLTGMVFSKVQWGAYWSWDPRQTSYLFVTLILLCGQAISMGFSDRERRDSVSASYGAITVLPIVFLTFVYPRLPQVKAMSLHPSTTIQEGGFDLAYKIGIYGAFLVLVYASLLMYRARLDALAIADPLDEPHGKLDSDRLDSPADRHRGPRMVRRDDGTNSEERPS
jgi:heme exporter protein C